MDMAFSKYATQFKDKDNEIYGVMDEECREEVGSLKSKIGTVPEGKTVEGQIDAIEDALETKAEQDGYYDELTAGNAEQLISNVYEEDSVPYNFRTSGGSIDIGDREFDEIVGGTVVWNQQAKEINSTNWHAENHVTATFTDGVASFTSDTISYGVACQTGLNPVSGHRYLFVITIKAAASCNAIVLRGGMGSSQKTISIGTTYETIGGIITATANASGGQLYVASGNRASLNVQIDFKNLIFVDLTQMFGSTIADYIESLETANAGSGIAYLKSLGWFTKDYYAYDAGSLQSVQVKEHRTTGFNQWDEEIESGYLITASGATADSDTAYRSKNFIPVIPGATYYFKTSAHASSASAYNRIFQYRSDYSFIGTSSNSTGSRTVVMASDAAFIKFHVLEAISNYGHDICINFHWDGERDGEYEAYSEHAYALDPDLVLRGIPKLDANNKLYYDGDVYESDGTVTRRYGVVDLGTLTYTKYDVTQGTLFRGAISDIKQVSASGFAPKCVCAKYETIDTSSRKEKTISQAVSNSSIDIIDSSYSDAATFKTAMSGVYLVYELATPTTESADPYQNPQIVDDFGTEEYVDAGVTASTPTRDVAIPVGHNTQYTANLKAKLEMSPDSPSSNGDYVVRHNNGTNSYVLLEKELPSLPSTDGTFLLKCTVSGTTKTLSWEEQT